jgi:hypothetical protein
MNIFQQKFILKMGKISKDKPVSYCNYFADDGIEIQR